jgi:hypothetical protein
MTTRRTEGKPLPGSRTPTRLAPQGFAVRPLAAGERRHLLPPIMKHHHLRQVSGANVTAPGAREASWAPLHRSPLLPRGWAPLSAEQQHAVLAACDAAPDRLTFRLGSVIHPEVDYRVYQLHNDTWGGLWVATRCYTDCDGVVANRELLGLDSGALRAVRIALDAFNSSDLRVRGQSWRLGVESFAVPPGDPRRI